MHKDTLLHIIRQKLEALEMRWDPTDWARMEALLDDQFEADIRTLFKNWQPDLKPDWAEMAAKLDEAFDAAIARKLNTYPEWSETPQWGLMRSLLEGETWEAAIQQGLLSPSLIPETDESSWIPLEGALDGDPFLTSLRQKADSFSEVETPDWDAMLAHMESDFDSQIKDKLALHQPMEPRVADWADLSIELDGGAFDQALRTKLGALELASSPKDWAAMAETLEAPFDEVVRGKMVAYTLPMQRQDWRLMAAALRQNDLRAAFGWRRYAVAAAAMLLFISSGLLVRENDKGSPFARETWSRLVEIVTPDWRKEQTGALAKAEAQVELFPDSPLSEAAGPQSDLSTGPTEKVNAELLSPVKSQVLQDNTMVLAEAATLDPHTLTGVEVATNESIEESEDNKSERNRFRLKGLSMPAFVMGSPQLLARTSDLFQLPNVKLKKPDFRVGFYAANAATRAEFGSDVIGQGYVAGLRLELRINNQWSFVTGLQHGKKRFSHEYYVDNGVLPQAHALD
ncbi:MAG: hypothetical protein AAFV07_14555, partial [Bacteroidota bacterium]